jgi:hypothetical protein
MTGPPETASSPKPLKNRHQKSSPRAKSAVPRHAAGRSPEIGHQIYNGLSESGDTLERMAGQPNRLPGCFYALVGQVPRADRDINSGPKRDNAGTMGDDIESSSSDQGTLQIRSV